MHGPALEGPDAPRERPGPVAVCRLGFRSDGRLTVHLGGAAPSRRLTLRRVHRGPLADLVAWHTAAVEGGPDPTWGGMGGGGVTPTEQFLYIVYEQVSVHLAELVAGLPRVALRLDDEVLTRLPLETAHRPDRPALFELTQCYRAMPGAGDAAEGPQRRRLRLVHRRGDECGLPAVALERALVGNAAPAGPGTSVIHVAGHEPRATAETVGVAAGDGQAHLVLSGCGSLPDSLPPGVASAVGTLWPVEDHACVTVMAAYHRRLAVGVGPLEALRQALLLHRQLPPDTWAAFAYLGRPV